MTTSLPPVRPRLDALWAWLAPLTAPERRIDVVGGITLVILLLTAEETWVLQVGGVSLAAAALIDRRLLRSAGYWFAVLAVYVAGVRGVLLLIDNHEFLLAYWLLALALSRLVDDPGRGLATSARLLIGFAFAFATLWKGVSLDYISGNTFHALLLFDPRFVGLAPVFSDLPFAAGQSNYLIIDAIRAVGDTEVAVPVPDAPGVRRLALAMTWWTIMIEGLVAACFLVSPRWLLGRVRHAVLLVFLFTTYVLAPVMGFGWLLIAMGVAQAPLDKHRLLIPAFAAAFVLVALRSTAPLGRLFALF